MNKETKIGLAVAGVIAAVTAVGVGLYKKFVKPADTGVEECNYVELPTEDVEAEDVNDAE